MRFRVLWPAGVLAIAAAFLAVFLISQKPVEETQQPVTDAAPTYPVERNIRYSYRIRNVSGEFLEKAEFWTYVPVRQTPTQLTRRIHSSGAYEVEIDQLGNQRLRYTLKNLPPYSSRTITIRVELGMSDSPNVLPLSDTGNFLEPEPYVESDSPIIQSLAASLRGDGPDETLANSYQWVAGNLRDEGYVQNDRGALYSMDTKIGDCTEYMYLLTALNRSNGIPTQGVAGFVVEEDAVLRPRDYHNWTVVLIDGRWELVDPHKEVFMSNRSDYVAMRLLGGAEQKPAVNAQTLFGTGAGIEVVMN